MSNSFTVSGDHGLVGLIRLPNNKTWSRVKTVVLRAEEHVRDRHRNAQLILKDGLKWAD